MKPCFNSLNKVNKIHKMALTVNKRIIQRQRAIKRRDYDTRAGKFRIQAHSSITYEGDGSKILALKSL